MTIEELEAFINQSWESEALQVVFGQSYCKQVISSFATDLLQEGIDKEWYRRRYTACCAWLLAHGDER